MVKKNYPNISRLPWALLFLLAMALTACDEKFIVTKVFVTVEPAPTLEATSLPAQTPWYQPITVSVLKNAQYHSPEWGDFQLVNGRYYRTPQNPMDSPQTYLTQLEDRVAFGDLDADGREDAVAFLSTQNGGTGHFIEMAAVLSQPGRVYNTSTVDLGDRVGVESAQITGGVITLGMRVHGPNDPLCCASQAETWQFQLENGQLVRLP